MGVLCSNYENGRVFAMTRIDDPVTICNTCSTEVRCLRKARKHRNTNVYTALQPHGLHNGTQKKFFSKKVKQGQNAAVTVMMATFILFHCGVEHGGTSGTKIVGTHGTFGTRGTFGTLGTRGTLGTPGTPACLLH